MSTEEQAIALGRRAVAAGWRWQPGALSLVVDAVTWRCIYGPTGEGLLGAMSSAHEYDWVGVDALIPDFRDPATLGVLRAQVVALVPGAVELSFAAWEMLGRPESRQMYWQDKECMCCKAFDVPHPYTDRWHIEALIAALEAAKAGTL